MITFFEDRIDEVREDFGSDEGGFTTAELIGNAALGVAALAFIYGAMRQEIFPRLITFMQAQLGI